jgi:hypothetical protein
MIHFDQGEEKANLGKVAMGWGARVDAIRYGKRQICLSALVAAFAFGGARADDTTPEIGTAVVIKREVVATLGDDKRDLREGGRVHRSE